MKPQSLALVTHLNNGGEVTRGTAWEYFGIQNITARLSELTSLGFGIIKTTFKALDAKGRSTRISAWKFRHPINIGTMVQVAADIGTYISLRGRIGKVVAVDLERALATVLIDSGGVGFRSLRFKALQPAPILTPGTAVTINSNTPLVVGEYNKEVDSYILLTPRDKITIVAHASLVRPCADAAHALP